MKKLIITTIAFIVFYNSPVHAQGQFSKRSLTIKAFISAVFKEKRDTRFIMDNYMFIVQNDSISEVKKETIIAAMIDTFLKRNGKTLASSEYQVFTYDHFKGDKKKFNTDDYKDIMILAVENKAVIYFYFNRDRIMSFCYIEKGSLSFFLII